VPAYDALLDRLKAQLPSDASLSIISL
jgi:hypothetical protein